MNKLKKKNLQTSILRKSKRFFYKCHLQTKFENSTLPKIVYLSHFTPCFFQLFMLENISLKIVHTFCRGGSMPSAHCDPSIEAEDPKLSESNSEQRE